MSENSSFINFNTIFNFKNDTINILLTSKSQVKMNAVQKFFDGNMRNKTIVISTLDCSECGLPEQPILYLGEDGNCFAKERLNYASKLVNLDDYDLVISIESCLEVGKSKDIPCDNNWIELYDNCFVLIYSKGILSGGPTQNIREKISDRRIKFISKSFLDQLSWIGPSSKISGYKKTIGEMSSYIKCNYWEELSKLPLIEYNSKIHGYAKTLGEIMHEHDDKIDPKNWMNQIYGIDRVDQIQCAIMDSVIGFMDLICQRNLLLDTYVTYPNYPKKGVAFQDIFPLFKDPKTLKSMIKFITNHYQYDCIDYVIGLESRGLCIGVPVAYELDVGFIPIRKENKLPGEVVKQTYQKEYGFDTCEMQQMDLKGKRILIIDDLVGTGGSLNAAIKLVESLGGIIVDCCVLREVPELRETYRKTLDGHNCTVLLQ
jgi:adenine phosphoribosyltransferase